MGPLGLGPHLLLCVICHLCHLLHPLLSSSIHPSPAILNYGHALAWGHNVLSFSPRMAFLLLLAKSYLSFKIQFRYHLLLEAFSDSSRLNEQTLLCSFTSYLALTTVCICPQPSILTAAAAAKLLQSCPTLCDPTDSSPPGSPVPGILQARTLEWVAIAFSLGAFFEDKDMPHIPGFPIPSPGLAVLCMFNRSEHACSNRPNGPKSVSAGDAGC